MFGPQLELGKYLYDIEITLITLATGKTDKTLWREYQGADSKDVLTRVMSSYNPSVVHIKSLDIITFRAVRQSDIDHQQRLQDSVADYYSKIPSGGYTGD